MKLSLCYNFNHDLNNIRYLNKMKTNFEKVVEFNKCFGLPHRDKPVHSVTRDDPKLTKLRLDLILEETRELQEAIENHDFTLLPLYRGTPCGRSFAKKKPSGDLFVVSAA